MHPRLSLLLLSHVSVCAVWATSEWYGDERAQSAPADAHAFYDITYDESICPHTELKSDAVPDFIYFGAMIAAFPVDNHISCLRECLSNSKCRSINFYEPMTYQQRGNCELLSETQYDNPRAMHPFRNAVYYERIHCRVDEFDVPTDGKATKGPGNKLKKPRVDNDDILKKLYSKVKEFNLKQMLRRA